MAGMHVRGAARQQKPVEPVEQPADIDLRPYRRDQNWQASCRVDNRGWILVVYPVDDPLVDFAETGRNADERQMASGHQVRLKARIGGGKQRRDLDIQTA